MAAASGPRRYAQAFLFGMWDDPIGAEKKWDRNKEALLEGRNPEESKHGDLIWMALQCVHGRKASAA